MKCKCGGKLKVIDSGKSSDVKGFLRIPQKFYYIGDFTYRLLKCERCEETAQSIELLVDDFIQKTKPVSCQ